MPREIDPCYWCYGRGVVSVYDVQLEQDHEQPCFCQADPKPITIREAQAAMNDAVEAFERYRNRYVNSGVA